MICLFDCCMTTTLLCSKLKFYNNIRMKTFKIILGLKISACLLTKIMNKIKLYIFYLKNQTKISVIYISILRTDAFSV